MSAAFQVLCIQCGSMFRSYMYYFPFLIDILRIEAQDRDVLSETYTAAQLFSQLRCSSNSIQRILYFLLTIGNWGSKLAVFHLCRVLALELKVRCNSQLELEPILHVNKFNINSVQASSRTFLSNPHLTQNSSVSTYVASSIKSRPWIKFWVPVKWVASV